MKIQNLKAGETGVVECVIMNIEERTNKNNGTFLNIQICDGDSCCVVKLWNHSKETFGFNVGDAVFVKIKADTYEGKVSYVAINVTKSSAKGEDFVLSSPINEEAMYNFLLKTSGKCGVYSETLTAILKKYKDKLLIWGAGKSVHHNIRGGLLYHTYRMVKIAAYVASIYNKEPSVYKIQEGEKNINTELLIAGTIIHDIGKLIELDTNMFGISEYTVKGTLMGHLFIGAELVGMFGRKHNLPEENIMLLQHMILAHHGKYEYQTVAIPAIPEAMLLHQIDMMDSSIYQFEETKNSILPGEMSNKVFGLDQRVYRQAKTD